MYSFIICIVALILGYFLYGKFVERIYGPDPARIAPAISKEDGIDYVPMPTWKVFMIQFLNIAGTGPIFGAIMGAKFGPSCYLWIVLGSIFAGAVHDYFCGMLSMRQGGAVMPDIVGEHVGKRAKKFMLIISLILLLLVGTVFVYSPALILGDIAPFHFLSSKEGSVMAWVGIVFLYYVIATLVPVDKLIGKIYPIFAFSLLFMAVALMVCLFIKWPSIPEFWDGLGNMHTDKTQQIFPCLFITVACGALSGFHSTQSPIMARCTKDERMGRPIFYGAMITEGIVALIWAAVSSYFFFDGGMAEVGATSGAAPVVVTSVAKSWLGIVGGILAILGVVAAPITSGDTAFRSARLVIADFFHIDQKPKKNRIFIALQIFGVAILLLWFNVANEDGFNIIWRYFGLANQVLAAFTLWTITAFLVVKKDNLSYLITMIPAALITSVCVTYLATARIGFNLPASTIPYIGVFSLLASIDTFYLFKTKDTRRHLRFIQVIKAKRAERASKSNNASK